MFRNFIISMIALVPVTLVMAKAGSAATPPEIITITVKSNGNATVNAVSYKLDNIHTGIEKKLWTKYLTTGKMQDRLKLQYTGEVLMGAQGAAMDELLLAQQNTIKKLCLKKYAKEFDMLTAVQQSYIKRKFPVLFQSIP